MKQHYSFQDELLTAGNFYLQSLITTKKNFQRIEDLPGYLYFLWRFLNSCEIFFIAIP